MTAVEAATMRDRGPAVVADRVTKTFLRGDGARTLRSFGLFERRTPVTAVRDVSLTIARGETFGLLGTNGSGKSTLLRMLAGITRPTTGTVVLRGRVGGLLTIGEGLDPLLTGEENALTGAILAGLSRRQALARLPAIAEFAGLDNVMDQPLRTYSDGMRLRLAFAAAVHIDPDLLLIDEILAVGDLTFRRRCLDHLGHLQAQGVTIIVASHDLSQLTDLCTRALWLDGGDVKALGGVADVVRRYEADQRSRLPAATTSTGEARRIGSGEIEVRAVRLSGADQVVDDVPSLRGGGSAVIEIDYIAHESIRDPIVGVSAHTIPDGVRCFDLSTAADGAGVGVLDGEGTITLEIDRMDLGGGAYHLDVGLYAPNWERPYDYRWRALTFEVIAPATPSPWVPPHRWST